MSDALEDGARVPNTSLHVPGLVVLYRKYPNADVPFGFPVPFKVAVAKVTDVAAVVVIITLGAST